ncbi:MAG: thioredoxin-disulfide reductase [Anaerolineae bacterium]|jgi:thioredoxin reductase (NADPH)|nr:thioredoxin-disulfide reductase [Anaerolineae bacterium]
MANIKRERMVIIGSGPAGFAAAVYAARAQLNPVMIAGDTLGGQLGLTHDIENYPGVFGGVSGTDLVERFKEQAEHFGTRIVYDLVHSVDFSTGTPFTVKTTDTTYLADSVIVTIGANPRKLNVPGEDTGVGRGVSYCGTCDGFFFRGKEIVVVGGGDSAIEEALFLTKFATKVEIIHRRDSLRAGVALQKRAFDNPKISFIWNSVVESIDAAADGVVSGVKLKNLVTGEVTDKPTQGVFIFIGHTPNSAVFGGQLATNDAGYVITDDLYRTNIDGVFAAGEIQDEQWRQVATSVGQGVSAAMSAIHWLQAREGSLQALDTEEAAPAAQ